MSSAKPRPTILDKPVSKGKQEVSISTYALLFSEIVQYSQNRVAKVADLHDKLSELGQEVGRHLVDVLTVRERGPKRENRLVANLNFIKGSVWKSLFGKEADKLELDNTDERTYYIIEKEPLVNKFISVPKDKGGINCASFTGGIVEAILTSSGFPCKVTVHWHKGTTYMIKFDESVMAREKSFDGR